jgi:hypothetical protein
MRYFGWGRWPRFRRYHGLANHLRFADRCCRRLARAVFHAMLVHRARLEHRQALLFRAVDVAIELFVLTVTIHRAKRMADRSEPGAESAVALAHGFACAARRRIVHNLRALHDNDDRVNARIGRALLAGEFDWLQAGIIGISASITDLTPPSMDELLAQRQTPQFVAPLARKSSC